MFRFRYIVAILISLSMIVCVEASENKFRTTTVPQTMIVSNDLLFDPSTFMPYRTYATLSSDVASEQISSAIISGGSIIASILQWLLAAFGSILATLAAGLIYRVMVYFGIQITQVQRDQFQSIIVNGLNDAAAKAEIALRVNPKLDIDIKNKIISDTVIYAQNHGAEIIKALGLNADSGEVVEAIRARIATALNNPNVPTPAIITPPEGMKVT